MLKATIRMPEDVEREYKELSALYGCSGNELVNNLIRAEYTKIGEDPKFKIALTQLQKMKKQFEEFSAELDKAGFKK